MKLSPFTVTIILSAVVAAGISACLAPRYAAAPQAAKETAYERVMRTNTLRCGYYVFSPMTIRDPNTGKLSGLGVDMAESIAAAANLKIEWAEEVDFGNWPASLQTGKFDALCTPTWPNASLAKQASFTRPTFYSSLNLYARGDDHRFDNNPSAIDDPNVTIAAIEGTPQIDLALSYFPKAKLLRLPQNSPGGTQAENVATQKADLLIWDANGVYEYLQSSPDGLHNVLPNQPLQVMPFEMAVNLGEYKLRDLLDIGIQSQQDTGSMNRLISKWERVPNSFFPVTKNYALPQ